MTQTEFQAALQPHPDSECIAAAAQDELDATRRVLDRAYEDRLRDPGPAADAEFEEARDDVFDAIANCEEWTT